jgi:hypothetical protein
MLIAIHHAFGDLLVLGERARLDEQLVDQRRLAVVDVGDDRDVAKVRPGRGHGDSVRQGGLAGVP